MTNEQDIIRRLNKRYWHARFLAAHDAENEAVEFQLAVARIGASDTNSGNRHEAALILSEYGTSIDRFRVLQLLGDSNWVVRSSAIYAAVRVLGERAQPLFLKLLNDRHYIVRRDAAGGLGDLGDKTTIPDLKSRLSIERHDQAKLGIWGALVALGERQYLKPMVMLYNSDTPGLRTAVWHVVLEVLDGGSVSAEERAIVQGAVEAARLLDYKPWLPETLDEIVARLGEMHPVSEQ